MNYPPLRLGIRANLAQFTLLIIVNAFVGAMVGLERTILPAIAEQDFHLAAPTAILSFIVVFGVAKALTNYFAGRFSDAVGRKLANGLIAREPFAEVAALADQCFRELLAAPHLVVRVNGELYGAAKEKLDELSRARGFEGRLVVMAEADIALGDCRIEWADGGLKRDRAATEAAIAEAVGRYIASRRGDAALL